MGLWFCRLCSSPQKHAGPLGMPQSHSYLYCADIRNREGPRAVAFTGPIRHDPLLLFPNHATFPDTNLSRSRCFDVALAGLQSPLQKTTESSKPCSVRYMFGLNCSNIGPGCFPFNVAWERGK